MLMLDTDIINSSSTGMVFISQRVPQRMMKGVVVYDKFTCDGNLLPLDSIGGIDDDNEDYPVWKFTANEAEINVLERLEIITTADVSDNLHGKHWLLNSPDDKYYVWYNTSSPYVAGDGDPNPGGGLIGIEVPIATNDNSAVVAATSVIAINLITSFSATASDNFILITIVGLGGSVDAENVDAGVIISITQQGGEKITGFGISNENIFPRLRPNFSDYSVFNPLQFNIVTELEYVLVRSVLHRIDIVRRRFPNPGNKIEGVALSGGFEKKFTFEELLDFLYQTMVEVNIHPPSTFFWFQFDSVNLNLMGSSSPYQIYSQQGVPFEMTETIILGTAIKAINSRQLFEIDTNFNISDAGISLSYDRDAKLGGVLSAWVQEYETKKKKLKWQFAPHASSAIGTFFGFGGHPIYGAIINSLARNGSISLRSLSPFFAGGRVG